MAERFHAFDLSFLDLCYVICRSKKCINVNINIVER